jgi:hypothetical protein
MWLTNAQRDRGRLLRNEDDYYVPAFHFDVPRRLPSIAFAIAWNEADASKLIPNRITFKKCLKFDLLNKIED